MATNLFCGVKMDENTHGEWILVKWAHLVKRPFLLAKNASSEVRIILYYELTFDSIVNKQGFYLYRIPLFDCIFTSFFPFTEYSIEYRHGISLKRCAKW